ncbi:MAG: hypothetical protein PHH71_03020 [Clostridia bacterium]|jgi:hypothetical protein|nr:hypothetical protein [Clostridia bacterium]MDD3232407.1 hypothetical protein [Clostridia bacterium]MDD3862465.1 hypothetical protein [Clostridia bacterium]MDD4408283.1 hypothetical protein [Clostridia bacterium]
MKLIVLLLGALFILILFNVGESNLRNNRIQKSYALLLIAIEIFSLLLPIYQITGINFTVSGFVIPAIISILFLGEIKNKKYLTKVIISFLSVVFLMQLLFLIQHYAVIEIGQLGWIVLSLALALVSLIICRYPKQAFISLFWGIAFSQITFNYTHFSTSELTDSMILGNETMFLGLVVGSVFMLLCYNVFYSVKRRRQAKIFLQNQ